MQRTLQSNYQYNKIILKTRANPSNPSLLSTRPNLRHPRGLHQYSLNATTTTRSTTRRHYRKRSINNLPFLRLLPSHYMLAKRRYIILTNDLSMNISSLSMNLRILTRLIPFLRTTLNQNFRRTLRINLNMHIILPLVHINIRIPATRRINRIHATNIARRVRRRRTIINQNMTNSRRHITTNLTMST